MVSKVGDELETHEECCGKCSPVSSRMLIWKEIQKQLISYCERNSIDVIPQTKYDADPILKAFFSRDISSTRRSYRGMGRTGLPSVIMYIPDAKVSLC